MDWIIHAVYNEHDENEPIDYHTHGLEKYGLKNLCMWYPGKEHMETCAGIINRIAQTMVDGEHYAINQYHIIDDDRGHLTDAFALYRVISVSHEYEEECLYIDYCFDEVVTYPMDGRKYICSPKDGKWKPIMRRENAGKRKYR